MPRHCSAHPRRNKVGEAVQKEKRAHTAAVTVQRAQAGRKVSAGLSERKKKRKDQKKKKKAAACYFSPGSDRLRLRIRDWMW